MKKPDYTYQARVERLIDGDTILAEIDLGFRLKATMPVRLAHINAPERNEIGGKAAREHLAGLLPADGMVLLKTYKPYDKYGRYLAEVYAGEVYVNDRMIADGHAQRYEGGVSER
jgi:endonuclease YncB( thermonuclease family)